MFGVLSLKAQTANTSLKNKIENIIQNKKADVGVSIIATKNDKIQINADKLYPMLSTFKFPIALTVLHKVEQRELDMGQKIFISIFVRNTYEIFEDTEAIIADISRTAYDYYNKK